MSEVYDFNAEIHDITVKREIGYFSFRASDIFRDAVYGLLRSEVREKMGSQALFLYSDYRHPVIRRNGTLRGEDGQMESAVRRMLEMNGNMPLPLARALRADFLPKTEEFALRTGVLAGPRLVDFMQDHREIPPKFRQGLSLPVHLKFPIQDVKPQEERVDEVLRLRQLVYGDDVHKVSSLNRKAEGHGMNVYDMKMRFSEIRYHHDDIGQV
ncbi:MAG TPA: hypothetical protein VGE13_01195 [Candidatus Saccharimonadales bacterium]